MGVELVKSCPPPPKQNPEWQEFPTGKRLGWGGQGSESGRQCTFGGFCLLYLWVGRCREGLCRWAGQATEGLVSQARTWECALEIRGRPESFEQVSDRSRFGVQGRLPWLHCDPVPGGPAPSIGREGNGRSKSGGRGRGLCG